MTGETNTAAAGDTSGRPARPDRPVRFADPARNAAYWARIIACVDAAPPLSDTQRAIIRAQFHAPQSREAA